MKITTDTSSLLSPKHQDIHVLPVSLSINGQTYKDYIDISTDQFINLINEGHIPTTSQPSIGDVLQIYEQDEEEILTITIADGLSGTYMNANTAKNCVSNPNRIHIINSKTLAGCLMYIVNKAKTLKDKGLSIQEIQSQLKESIENSISFVIPRNFEFLARSGRLTPIAAKIGQMLKIVPVLTQTKDKLRIEPFTIKRTMNKAISSIIMHLKKINIDETYNIYISHAGAKQLAEKTLKQFKETFSHSSIEILELSPSLSTHGGPGCLLIQAIKK